MNTQLKCHNQVVYCYCKSYYRNTKREREREREIQMLENTTRAPIQTKHKDYENLNESFSNQMLFMTSTSQETELMTLRQ